MASHSPWFWLGVATIAAIATLQTRAVATKPLARITDSAPESTKLQINKLSAGDIPMPADAPSAHASSLVPLSAKHSSSLAAVWFAGERESAPDVRIAFSHFDRTEQRWMPARYIATREAIGQSLGFGIRRLGNPVLWKDDDDRLHLFVVATGLGGWAASRIVHLQQQGDPYSLEEPHFEPKQVLPLSWLWNTSHLVRNPPLTLGDGGAALPVYFEIGAKYPVLVRLSRNGELIGINRISARRNLLQPALVPVDAKHWLAYMRMSGGTQRIAVAETRDGGLNWQDSPDLALPNPNASVAAMSLGHVKAMAFNPSITTRDSLSLALSADGRDWVIGAELEAGKAGEEFSYPAMAWVEEALWVSYTKRREKIAWQRFGFTKD